MEIVNFLAQLWGFSLVIICLAFLLKPRDVEGLLNFVHQDGAMITFGIINVILGVASLIGYHTFDQSWHVVITILGILVLVRGLACLFVPQFVQQKMMWALQTYTR